MGMLQPFQDCGAIIREIAGQVKRILDMPAMFVWYFKEEKKPTHVLVDSNPALNVLTGSRSE